MGMPSGDSPAKAHQYYEYLQSHSQTMQVPATWHVHWLDLAWLWGFLLALALIIIWWLWQYRSTRQRIYPADQFGGYTFERMLVDVAGITAQPTLVMEKIF